MQPIVSDVAIIIYSRGREACLARLLGDLVAGFTPALDAAGLTSCIWVYAQGYGVAYLDSLSRRFADQVAARELVVIPSTGLHLRIGEVAQAAIAAVHARSRYRLAMLMDDDSVYAAHPLVDGNLGEAARRFLEESHRACSIKLGGGEELRYGPFVDLAAPIMPFKEKMLWASRAVLEEALALPRFAELSIGEDAVIAAVAWLAEPRSCFAVHGMATFLHLGFEGEGDGGEIAGGYADLTRPPDPSEAAPRCKYDEALRSGITPHAIMPDIFVPKGHPHYAFNGVREEVAARVRAEGERCPSSERSPPLTPPQVGVQPIAGSWLSPG